ncbi:MAG: AarF/UbiB family protein, partial [Pseudomonadota bacterium]
FANTTRAELKLHWEGASATELAENFADNDLDFVVPKVDWQRTSRRILTTSFVDGIRVDDLDGIANFGLDATEILERCAKIFFLQVFRDGFFHADMHPGNVFITNDGSVVPVDFGIMGRLNVTQRRFLARMLTGFIERDYHAVSDVHFDHDLVGSDQDRNNFLLAMRAVGEPLQGKSLAEISLAQLLANLFETTREFSMQTQPELLLLQKTLFMCEGLGRIIDPNVNMWLLAKPLIAEWIVDNLSPLNRIQSTLEELQALGLKLPEALDALITIAETMKANKG